LTSSSHAITSIKTSAKPTASYLSASSIDTLLTVSPAVLPNKSAAAMRLALGENDAEEDEFKLKDREIRDEKWQILALLSERSTVQEALRTLH
jgi:hypothetical protein